MKKILITGITGFVGSHLAEYCLLKGDEVHGTVQNQNISLKNIEDIKSKINVYECELRDQKNVVTLIETTKPDIIFHLAAQSFVPTSWSSPVDTLTNNIVSEVNLFEVVKKAKLDPVIQIACSSEEYGMVYPDETPVKETNRLRPMSPYGVSKITQEMLAFQYEKSYKLRTVVTRAFNHEGPRRGLQFVTANFANQVARAEEGGVIKVGNLEAIRDYTDVRDMVKAYYLATTSTGIVYGEPYNVCSGKGWKIEDVLRTLIAISGKELYTEQDPNRMRPSDVPVLIGDSTKFREATGWKPEIPFEQTLKDIYDYEKSKT